MTRPPSTRLDATTTQPVLRGQGPGQDLRPCRGSRRRRPRALPRRGAGGDRRQRRRQVTLIKCLSGAETPNEGEMHLDGEPMQFRRHRTPGRTASRPSTRRSPWRRRSTSRATCSSVVSCASPVSLGSVFRMLDGAGMRKTAKEQMTSLGIGTLQNMGQAVETPVRRPASGGRGRPRRSIRQQGHHSRRADRGTRRARSRQPGAQADRQHPRSAGCRSSSSRTTCRRSSRWPTASTSSDWASAQQSSRRRRSA